MKEILRQYGKMLIATIVGSVMITLAAGIMPQLSDAFNLAGKDKLNSSYVGDSYDSSRNNELPRIKYDSNKQLVCGSELLVEDYVYAQYKDGSKGECRVYAIIDSNGNECPINWEKGGRYFYFEEPGIYEVYVKTKGSSYRLSHARIKLPVN